MRCIACDFGGSSVKYALVDHAAILTEKGETDAPLQSREAFVDTVAKLYERFGNRVDGIAVSLPGLIDAKTGMHHGSGVYAPILRGHNVIQLLQERCPTRITVENDGKCGALAEAWNGALSDVRTGAVLVLGTAIGGGIILNGDVQRGCCFSAGEFSFAVTGGDDYSMLNEAWMNVGVIGLTYKVCKYKNLDLSCQDAAPMLLRYDGLFRDRFPSPEGKPAPVKADGRQIFRWLDEGDADTWRAYREFLHSLTILIHNIQVCVAPDRIALGGGLSREGRLLSDLAAEQEVFYERAMVPPSLRSHITTSRYLRDCNLIGAAYHFMRT